MKKKITLGNVIAALVNNGVVSGVEFPTDPTQKIPIMDLLLTEYEKCKTYAEQIRYWIDYLEDGLRVPEWVLADAERAGSAQAATKVIEDYLECPQRITNWALGLLLCRDALVACGLYKSATGQIKAVAAQEFIYKADPAVCSVFTALADSYRMHIDPGVYARGLSVVPELAVTSRSA